MIDAPQDVGVYFTSLVALHRERIYTAIRNNDRESLQAYVDHIKCTKGNQIALNIKRRYPQLQDEAFMDVILTLSRSSRKSCDVTLPLMMIKDLQTIDVEAQLVKFMGRFMKVIKQSLDEKDQLKIVKLSAFKKSMKRAIDAADEYDIVVRGEKGLKHGRSHNVESVVPEQYQRLHTSKPQMSFHEMIVTDTIRFTMDVDGCEYEDSIDAVINNAYDILRRYLPTSQIHVYYIKNESKYAYHVYSNVSCSVHMAKAIASEIAHQCKEKNIIDTKIYRHEGSLRLFDCPKIDIQGHINMSSIYRLPQHANPLFFMMTALIDTHELQTPIHMLATLGIDESYLGKDHNQLFTTEAKKETLQWMKNNNIEGTLQMTPIGARIVCKQHTCPQHNSKIHAREGYSCNVKKDTLYITCFADGKQQPVKIELDQHETVRLDKRIRAIEYEPMILDGALIQDQRYFKLDS